MSRTQLVDIFFCGQILLSARFERNSWGLQDHLFSSFIGSKKARRLFSNWMWPREFTLPFQKQSKHLNKGWEMICSFEKCNIFKRMLNRNISTASFVCSHSYTGLFKYPWAALVSPLKRNTINHAVTQRTHECQMAGGSRQWPAEWHCQNSSTEVIICEDWIEFRSQQWHEVSEWKRLFESFAFVVMIRSIHSDALSGGKTLTGSLVPEGRSGDKHSSQTDRRAWTPDRTLTIRPKGSGSQSKTTTEQDEVDVSDEGTWRGCSSYRKNVLEITLKCTFVFL